MSQVLLNLETKTTSFTSIREGVQTFVLKLYLKVDRDRLMLKVVKLLDYRVGVKREGRRGVSYGEASVRRGTAELCRNTEGGHGGPRVRPGGQRSVVVVAVRAQDVAAVGEEAGAHQRHGAARALEAGLVPLAVLEGHVLPVSEACGAERGGVTAATEATASTP